MDRSSSDPAGVGHQLPPEYTFRFRFGQSWPGLETPASRPLSLPNFEAIPSESDFSKSSHTLQSGRFPTRSDLSPSASPGPFGGSFGPHLSSVRPLLLPCYAKCCCTYIVHFKPSGPTPLQPQAHRASKSHCRYLPELYRKMLPKVVTLRHAAEGPKAERALTPI